MRADDFGDLTERPFRGTFIVSVGRHSWVRLDGQLRVLDCGGTSKFKQEVHERLAESLKDAPSLNSLDAQVERIREAFGPSTQFGLEDPVFWDLAGAYFDDAQEWVRRDRDENERLVPARDAWVDELRRSISAGDDPNFAPRISYLLIGQRRRMTCIAAIGAIFSAEEAAFFQATSRLQLTHDLAEHLGRQNFPQKWHLLFASQKRPVPQVRDVEKRVRTALDERNVLVHVPARLKRDTPNPDTFLSDRLPANDQLGDWLSDLHHLLSAYFDGLGLSIDLPHVAERD